MAVFTANVELIDAIHNGAARNAAMERLAADTTTRTADGGLGLFVRSLIGLDRKAAATAFGDFLVGRALTGNQLEFVNMLIEHLTARGVVDPELLYQSPFTDVDPMGVSGVFSDADASTIVDILRTVRKNAAA